MPDDGKRVASSIERMESDAEPATEIVSGAGESADEIPENALAAEKEEALLYSSKVPSRKSLNAHKFSHARKSFAFRKKNLIRSKCGKK